MRKYFVLATLVVLMFALPALAVDHPQKVGKWQMKMEMEMPGMPMKIPPVTIETCLTAEDLADPKKAIPNDPKSDCKVSDYKVDGSTVTWSMECPKSKMTGTGQMTYSDNTYTGKLEMKVGDQEMKTRYTGKWLGACTK